MGVSQLMVTQKNKKCVLVMIHADKLGLSFLVWLSLVLVLNSAIAGEEQVYRSSSPVRTEATGNVLDPASSHSIL